MQQWSAGFNSHFLALAYQADRLPDALGTGTIRGNALRVAIWGRHNKVGGGGTATWHTGDDGGVAFDAGVLYRATPVIDLGAVLGNIGQPTVRGIELKSVLVPAVTLHTTSGAVALQTQAEIQTDGLQGFAVGTAIHVGVVHLTARLETDGEFRRESFTFGLSIGGLTRVGTLVSSPGDLSELESTSVHLTSEKSNQPRRRSR